MLSPSQEESSSFDAFQETREGRGALWKELYNAVSAEKWKLRDFVVQFQLAAIVDATHLASDSGRQIEPAPTWDRRETKHWNMNENENETKTSFVLCFDF